LGNVGVDLIYSLEVAPLGGAGLFVAIFFASQKMISTSIPNPKNAGTKNNHPIIHLIEGLFFNLF
jgi:hypothetical protein